MEPIPAIYVFTFIFGSAALCLCLDKICKKCSKKIQNTSWIFTPPTTPDSHVHPASPACSIDADEDPLPSPATMKPDYSSSEEYLDIYNEYRNSMDAESP